MATYEYNPNTGAKLKPGETVWDVANNRLITQGQQYGSGSAYTSANNVAVGGAPTTPATPTGSNLSQAQLDTIEAQISGILKKASEIAAEEKKAPRKYFDVDDFPVECTSINSEGEKDLEIVRIVGFLTQAVRDLAEEVDLLKKNKK